MKESDWFSAGAVMISIVALLVAWNTARSQQRLAEIEQERRREEVDARERASMEVELEHEDGSAPWLLVRNRGQAVARNVNVTFEPIGDGAPWQLVEPSGLPIASLPPGPPVRFRLPLAMGDAAKVRAMATWEDGTGSHKAEFTLGIV